MKNLSKKGFTLVELLVVISIIALLSTIAVVSLGSARAKARDTARIADMKQVSTALEQYYADQGGYPPVAIVGTSIVIGDANHKVLCSLNTAGGSSFNTAANCPAASTTTYMGNIPAYPTPGLSTDAITCTASTTPDANFCYTSDKAWSANTDYAIGYTMIWALESSNTTLGGRLCKTTPSGVTCT